MVNSQYEHFKEKKNRLLKNVFALLGFRNISLDFNISFNFPILSSMTNFTISMSWLSLYLKSQRQEW